MYNVAAKKAAAKAGLELYWNSEWRLWGLCEPSGRVESIWMSSDELRAVSPERFASRYIGEMLERIATLNQNRAAVLAAQGKSHLAAVEN